MKRLRLINDDVLGVLLCVALGFQRKVNGFVQFMLFKNSVPLAEQLDYSLLQKMGLLETKTVLSPRTLVEGNHYQTLLIQKSQAALVGGMSHGEIEGIRSLRKQAEELDLFLKHLEGKYGVLDKGIDYKDYVKIAKDFSAIEDTLYYCLSFNSKQVAKLKKYLKRYWIQYANRDLSGQEKLALPDVYTKAIISKFNNPQFINIYGRKRIIVYAANTSFFCHTIFHLYQKGLIKTQHIKLIGSSVENITIDNFIAEEDSHQNDSAQVGPTEESKIADNKPLDGTAQAQIAITPDSEIKWHEDFKWQGDNFVFGNYGSITFSSDDRKKLFKLLTDAKGNWVSISKLKGGKNVNYVRPTIKQIEDRFTPKIKSHISIPSTQDDNLKPKPNQGAYRIKFTPRPKQP